MNGDLMPTGGHHRKADPKHAKAIKEGGKIAQKIAKESTAIHQAEDVPKAEELLLEGLEGLEDSHLESAKK